jgi:hypothetical protein
MKIVNIAGGLGNQMFQYAFALSLKDRFPDEDVYIDTSHYHTIFFSSFKGISLHNGYEIDKVFPNASLPVAGWKQIIKVSYFIPNYVLSRLGRKFLPVRSNEIIPPYSKNLTFMSEVYRPGDFYYEGFWQSVGYFTNIKDRLVEVYSHSVPNHYNRELIKSICNCNSVGVHIRRGDYLKEPTYCNICTLNYYKSAIELILSDNLKHTFYLFSNDIEWCRENITPIIGNNDVVYVAGNNGIDSCWDMFLMTYCKDLVIANSSFSWWGAFLNKKANRIIAPDPWINRNCKMDIYDDKWIRLGGNNK